MSGQFGTKWLQTEKLHVRRNQPPPILLMMHAYGWELAGTDDAGRELAGTGRELR